MGSVVGEAFDLDFSRQMPGNYFAPLPSPPLLSSYPAHNLCVFDGGGEVVFPCFPLIFIV